MLVGMGVFAGLAALGFATVGASLSDPPGAVRVLLMGVYMVAPMALWMGYRGHPARLNLETAAAMLLPSGLAALLTGTGALSVLTALRVAGT